MEIVLASNSPRRRELLALGGWPFRVQAADVDETPLDGEPAPAYVIRLAHAKVCAVGQQLGPGALVLAADTTVSHRSRILGKPVDADDATRMLRQLRGRKHAVLTGLALLRTADGQMWQTICLTEVPMRRYSDAEIRAYVLSGDPLDKAGAYAIQHAGFHPAAVLHGCYANVMGLPLCHLVRLLRQAGIGPAQSIPQACQEHLAYSCTVYPEFLRPERTI
jgi:MAF protein